MDDKSVLRVVQTELDRADDFVNARIAFERKLAYDYYYGREFGNEIEGRSRVISADVAQAIDAAVPEVMEIFVAGDKAVEFTPRNQEDVGSAEQATLSANYVFFTQNNGFALAHDFIKDGLLQKIGAFKWKWDTSITLKEKTFKALDEGTMALLSQSPDTEIVGVTDLGDGTSDVTVRVKKEAGRIKIVVPPPEEIKISPDAMTLDVMDMPFIAHTPLLTSSDLIEMGIDPKVIDELPKGDEKPDDDAKIARKDRTDSAASLLDEDDTEGQDTYRYNECYVRVDADDDGVAELRKVCFVGDTILHNEAVDHIPIAVWTPKVMPHEVVGVSLADDAMDLQLLKSTIWRMTMDSWYHSVFPRLFVKGDVNMDDVLTIKPGAPIRGEMNSELLPITVPFAGQTGFQMLEYADQEKDARLGFSPLGPGLDPDSINKTATYVRAETARTDSRKKLIARNAAEYGFKPLFKGIMYLLAKHQQQALMVRLNNKFVPVDPETWEKEYDMTCNVGLGVGSKEQQLMQLQNLSMDLQAIAASPFAPVLLGPDKVFNAFEKKANLAGFKDATIFLNNPIGPDGRPVQPPPPPEPEMVQAEKVKAQTQMQLEPMKLQSQAQIEQLKTANNMQQSQHEAMVQAELKKYEIEKQAELKRFEAEQNAALEKYKIDRQIEADILKAQIAAGAQVQAAYKEQGIEDPEDETVQAEKAKTEEAQSRRDMISETTAQALIALVEQIARPKRIVRGPDGRAAGVE